MCGTHQSSLREMKAKEMKITAEGKFSGIASIKSIDDLTIQAEQGIDLDGRAVTRFIFVRTERDTTTTDINSACLESKQGRVRMDARNDAISVKGAKIVGGIIGSQKCGPLADNLSKHSPQQLQ